MRKSNKLHPVFSIFFCLVLAIGISPAAAAQKKLKTFEIIVARSNGGIKLTCTEGCAWKELGFSVTGGSFARSIDQYGVLPLKNNEHSELPGNQLRQTKNAPAFIFTMETTEKGLSFTGLKGTSWKQLSFTCLENCQQAIDENGMTSTKIN